MKNMNKKLLSKILLLIVMVSVLTFLTGCAFSSSSLNSGIDQIARALKMMFDGVVGGLVSLIVGIFEGFWNLLVGIFNVIIGAIAWVVEAIVGLF